MRASSSGGTGWSCVRSGVRRPPSLLPSNGVVQGERNAIEPRKHPLSSMTPTIVSRDGVFYLALGSPGRMLAVYRTWDPVLGVPRVAVSSAVKMAAPS